MAIAHLTGWVKWAKNDKIPSDDKSWLIRNGPNHNYIVDAITTNNQQVNEVHTTTRLNQCTVSLLSTLVDGDKCLCNEA